MVNFNKAARNKYMKFSTSPQASWKANFRDLNSSVTRMATLSEGGRISENIVEEEIIRLKNFWSDGKSNISCPRNSAIKLLGENKANQIDLFDQYMLMGVSQVCKESKSMAEAGRKLFNISRLNKTVPNDSHRLKQLLSKFGLDFSDID